MIEFFDGLKYKLGVTIFNLQGSLIVELDYQKILFSNKP